MQQGNWITREQVDLLQPGMSREQVRFALGSPTLTSVLHADRWDYPYYFKPGYGKPQERQFTVFFEHDRLVRWVGDEQPELQPFQIEQMNAKQAVEQNAMENRAIERAEQIDGVNSQTQLLAPDDPVLDMTNEPGSSPEPLL